MEDKNIVDILVEQLEKQNQITMKLIDLVINIKTTLIKVVIFLVTIFILLFTIIVISYFFSDYDNNNYNHSINENITKEVL